MRKGAPIFSKTFEAGPSTPDPDIRRTSRYVLEFLESENGTPRTAAEIVKTWAPGMRQDRLVKVLHRLRDLGLVNWKGRRLHEPHGWRISAKGLAVLR